MTTIAVITHKDGTVAPLDDSVQHYEAVKLYEMDKDGTERAVFPFDAAAEDFDIRKALQLAHATDVIAQHYEEDCFEILKGAGLRLWLEAPAIATREALRALHDGELPEAAVGAHALHGPTGRVVEHAVIRTHEHEHKLSAGDDPVITPMRGGKSLI